MQKNKIEPQNPSTPGNAKHQSRQVHKKNGYNPKNSADTGNSKPE